MTPSAVIQVKRGIGDVIWHLPFIRAIAAVSPGRQVTFLAPPSSHAKELLAAEPSVAATLYFEHEGSELRRGLNLIRLVKLLRQHRFSAVWILDRTTRPALAAMLAGIPERIGLGLGAQQRFITNPGIDRRHFHDEPVDWLRALMLAMQVPLPTTEPALRLSEDTLAAIVEKFVRYPRPWIALGIGASHAQKEWPDEYSAAFLVEWRNPPHAVGCCAARRHGGVDEFRIGQHRRRAQQAEGVRAGGGGQIERRRIGTDEKVGVAQQRSGLGKREAAGIDGGDGGTVRDQILPAGKFSGPPTMKAVPEVRRPARRTLFGPLTAVISPCRPSAHRQSGWRSAARRQRRPCRR